MRVLLNRRDEGGAIALMVAALMLVLCILGAFVVDFGQAYVTKNQAQETADASALAAGKVYMLGKAHCVNGFVLGGDALQAKTAADTIRTENMPSSIGALDVHCDVDDAVKVGYDVTATSPLGLGALVTGTSTMTVARHAAVKYGTAQEGVGNLRPWMICAAQVPDTLPSSVVTEIGLPGNGHNPPPTGCTPNKPGEWWKSACFNAGGSHGDAYQNVLVGCDSVTLAKTTAGNPNPYAELVKACTNPPWNGVGTPNKNTWIESTSCLADDTGRDVKGMDTAWATLLGKTIAMPVFCDAAPVGKPQCSPSSIPNDPKVTWPVWKIAAVEICGYALKGVWSSSTLPTGDCNNMNTNHLDPRDFTNDQIGFLVIFKGMIEPGGSDTFPVQTNATMRLVE